MESDLPRKLEFGISINPSWSEQEEMLALVRLAESGGLDLVGVQDHPYQWRFYDTWTLISYLGGATSSIRFFPDVAALPLRPPAMLAKSVASLDVLTGGRVELGLGAGAFWEAIGAMGGEVRSRAEAVAAIEEAIDVIRLVWSGERGVRYQGRHYRLSGLHTGPEPVHDIGIWVGARGPRMLDLIGRKGDGWVPSASWAPVEELPPYLRRIEEAASRAGRDAGSIRRIYNVGGSIRDQSDGRFVGPPEQWVEDLTAAVEAGMDIFIFWPEGEGRARQVERFASEVVPEVRAAFGDR
ncbi:MAG TPA: LLM class flavin-dependent oxidoreductase [Acidimicrobiia bacterium]